MSTTYTAKGMRHANVAGAEVSSIRKTMVYTVHMYGHCSPSSQNVPLHPSTQVHVAGWDRQVPPFLHVGLHTAKRVGLPSWSPLGMCRHAYVMLLNVPWPLPLTCGAALPLPLCGAVAPLWSRAETSIQTGKAADSCRGRGRWVWSGTDAYYNSSSGSLLDVR